jgi:hypothetical protein
MLGYLAIEESTSILGLTCRRHVIQSFSTRAYGRFPGSGWGVDSADFSFEERRGDEICGQPAFIGTRRAPRLAAALPTPRELFAAKPDAWRLKICKFSAEAPIIPIGALN